MVDFSCGNSFRSVTAEGKRVLRATDYPGPFEGKRFPQYRRRLLHRVLVAVLRRRTVLLIVTDRPHTAFPPKLMLYPLAGRSRGKAFQEAMGQPRGLLSAEGSVHSKQVLGMPCPHDLDRNLSFGSGKD